MTLKGHRLSLCVWSCPAIGRDELIDYGKKFMEVKEVDPYEEQADWRVIGVSEVHRTSG